MLRKQANSEIVACTENSRANLIFVFHFFLKIVRVVYQDSPKINNKFPAGPPKNNLRKNFFINMQFQEKNFKSMWPIHVNLSRKGQIWVVKSTLYPVIMMFCQKKRNTHNYILTHYT